jgi:hypothetical protein
MEKQAVVKVGHSPSIVSGNKSEFIKNGYAFCKGEDTTVVEYEKRLAKSMSELYNDGNDAAENN